MELPRLLIIAGTGRESGKTTLACRIIKNFCNSRPIIAVKISPHRHYFEPGGKIITQRDNLYIAEETDTGTGKDSSRMLAAGARRSFFVMAPEDLLLEAIHQIIDITGNAVFMICESGGLRRWVEPGLFLVVSGTGQKDKKPIARDLMAYEHTWISFDGIHFDFDINRIVIHDDGWKTEQDHDFL
jgi:hypothetical protein